MTAQMFMFVPEDYRQVLHWAKKDTMEKRPTLPRYAVWRDGNFDWWELARAHALAQLAQGRRWIDDRAWLGGLRLAGVQLDDHHVTFLKVDLMHCEPRLLGRFRLNEGAAKVWDRALSSGSVEAKAWRADRWPHKAQRDRSKVQGELV